MDQNRPKTRGLEASEAEEDAKIIKAALKEPAKINYKRIQQKLKSDFGKGDSESDDEEKLFYQQPPYDDDEADAKPGVKRRRFGGRRNVGRKRGKAGDTGGTEEEVRRTATVSAKLTAIIKEELKPKIVPYNKSSLEHKQVHFKLGDIVSIQKETLGAEKTKFYAQILGFHTDQFCERYASVRWLIPDWDVQIEKGHVNSILPESFRTYIDEPEPISLNCCKFVLRPPAWYLQPDNPSAIPKRSYYIYHNDVFFLDTPSPTLTSADKRY